MKNFNLFLLSLVAFVTCNTSAMPEMSEMRHDVHTLTAKSAVSVEVTEIPQDTSYRRRKKKPVCLGHMNESDQALLLGFGSATAVLGVATVMTGAALSPLFVVCAPLLVASGVCSISLYNN